MSIKPRFGEEVLSGSKRYELRRLVGPLVEPGDVGVGEEDLKYVEGARYAMLIQVRDPARCRTAVRLSEIGEPPPPSYRKVAKKKAERLATLCGL